VTPFPTTIVNKIGYIGNMHGVKAIKTPKRKKPTNTSAKLY
jgi:hypothetical protein